MGFGSSEIRMNKRKQSLVHCRVRGAWGFPPAPPLTLAGRPRVADAGVVSHPTAPGPGSFPDK